MKLLLAIFLATIAACCGEAVKEDNASYKQWALLVAGSSGWYNYRHQADIAHAYKLLIERGIPASNIVVMMYNDVVNNTENPNPGVLINKPNGADVYKGIKIDYKGEHVTPKNFLAVLSGNKKAVKGVGTGRVIGSGSNDHVFVNFADHGGSGILCFPDDDLAAEDLISTLKSLTKSKKYGKLLLYIEACEAGSNFDGLLPENTKILASTASATDESSWGWYCDYETYPCLGDLYSINWMEHLDKKISAKENIFNQYQTIRTLTTESHVNLYGDYSFGTYTVNQFVGPNNVAEDDNNENSHASRASGVPSRDVALHYMQRMAKNGQNNFERMKYAKMAQELKEKRSFVDETVDYIVAKIADNDDSLIKEIDETHQSLSEDMLSCHKTVYKHFSKRCFNLNKNQYVLKHFYKFTNICHMSEDYEDKAIEAINSVCHENFPHITNTY